MQSYEKCLAIRNTRWGIVAANMCRKGLKNKVSVQELPVWIQNFVIRRLGEKARRYCHALSRQRSRRSQRSETQELREPPHPGAAARQPKG